MNKLLYIYIFIIFLLLVLIASTWILQKKDSPELGEVVYTDFDISLPVSQGNNIVVDNFLKAPSVTPDSQNPGMYFLGNVHATSLDAEKPKYIITYEKQTGYFNIVLLERPFKSSQLDAEIYLKQLLQVDEDYLCKLSYKVTIPGYIDDEASGIDYRFSFCSGNTPI